MAQKNSQSADQSQVSQQAGKPKAASASQQNFGKQTYSSGTASAQGSSATATQSMVSSQGQAAVKSSKSASVKPSKVSAISHEQIAARAKAIWQAKGCNSGKDLQNWLEAEAQLKKETGLA